jgi:uncharacterized membrane protein
MGLLQSFLNPWLLSGVALASAPIIIHLFNRRRFRVENWAAMDFLIQAASTNRRRVKFEDLLLLLLRTLAILFLVLAVSRPVVRGLGDWQEDRRIVVIDDSFSTQLTSTMGSVFELARENAMRHVRDAVGGSIPVMLYSGSEASAARANRNAAGKSIPGTPYSGSEKSATGADQELTRSGGGDAIASDPLLQGGWHILQTLEAMQPTDLPLKLDRIIDRVVEETESEALERQSIVVVSDFRKIDWQQESGALTNGLAVAFERIRDHDLSNRLAFQFVDVGRQHAGNLAVTSVKISSRHALAGASVALEVEVTNFSDAPRPSIQGTLEILATDTAEPRPMHRIPLPPFTDLQPGESRTVQVNYSFEKEGFYLLRASVDMDALPGDDKCHAVLEVRPGLRVLLVDGDPGAERFSGEAGFLTAALKPRGDDNFGVLPRTTTDIIEPSDLDNVDVALVLNRERLDPGEIRLLRQFVAEGGGLGFFLGTRVVPEFYNELARVPTEASEEEVALFPVRLGEPRGGTERVGLTAVDESHPTFKVYRGVDGSSFNRPLFSRYFEVTPNEGARVIAAYADSQDTPAIIEQLSGNGRIVVINSSADRDWSDWATDPSYTVLLQEWVRHLSPRRQSALNVECGSTIDWKHSPGQRYVVVTPRGERVPVDLSLDGKIDTVRFSRTTQAGFYRLEKLLTTSQTAALPNEAFWYACQRKPEESNLEAIEAIDLSRLLEEQGIRFSIGQDAEIEDLQREQEGELWRWLALAVGSLLLVELLAAWWFGRR